MDSRQTLELARRIVGGWTEPVLQVKAVHDWIILNTAYEEAVLEGREAPSFVYRAEGVFERRKAVCAGYAEAARMLLDALGIPALYVTNADHAWNMVQIAGIWYHLDVTWDDPVPDTPGRVRYTFFLVSSTTLAETREFRPAKPAPRDFLAGVPHWDGRPVVHSPDEAVTAFAAAPRDAPLVSMLLWRQDPKAIIARVREEFGGGLFGRGDSRALGCRYSEDRFLSELEFAATRGDLDRFPGHLMPPPADSKRASIEAVWFRLRDPGTMDAVTVRADGPGGIFGLDRSSAKVFKGVRDPEGNPLYKYFDGSGAPLLEFQRQGGGWRVRAPVGSVNGFALNGDRLDANWREVRYGDSLVLFSRRRSKVIDTLRLAISDR